jgi:hypothetical protein
MVVLTGCASESPGQSRGEGSPSITRVVPCVGTRNLPIVPEDDGCKAILEAVADQVRHSPSPVYVVVDGYAYRDERPGVEVARADWARTYLVKEKGLDPGQVVMRWIRLDEGFPSAALGTTYVMVIQRGTPVPAASTPRVRSQQWLSGAASN